jgi:hypothetical protein
MRMNEQLSEFSPKLQNNLYLYTKGGEYSLNGQNYVGEYHLESNKVFTGPIPDLNTQQLHRVYANIDLYTYDQIHNFNVGVLTFVDPIPYLYKPKEQAYINGFDARYFVEKTDDALSYTIEINQAQYDNINNRGGIDGGLYQSATLNWQLIGSKVDIINHNQLEIARVQSKLPTIAYSIPSPTQYARFTLV